MRYSLLFAVVSLLLRLAASSPVGPIAPPYVPGPSQRGTVGLVTSCLITLSLCVWTAIHLNIHQPLNSPFGKKCTRKLSWSLCAIFVPEWVLVWAMEQLLCALALCKQRNKYLEEGAELALLSRTDNDEPPLTHVNCPLVQRKKGKEPERWKLAQGWFGFMGGIVLILREEDQKFEKGRNCTTVTPRGIVRLAEWGMLPDIQKSVVSARGKSSRLAKALVIFQTSWMFIQIIARKIAGLPATLLELNTIAHVCCAFVMYLMWWSKPQDVDEPIIIDVSDCVPCSEHLKRENFNSDGLAFKANNHDFSDELAKESFKPDQIVVSRVLALGGAALVYGGIHLAAWNAYFPTSVERLLWRISACIVTGEAVALIFILWVHYSGVNQKVLICLLILVVPYLFGRIYLVMEAFISVRSLPVAAYETVDWVGFLPHVG